MKLTVQPLTMKLAPLVLLAVLTSALPVAPESEESNPGPSESRSAFAALDDVRLVANGLLQLGKNLRDFVQKTKSQINDILQKINIFDESFYQLSTLTSEIREEEEELKKTTVALKANNQEIKSLSLEISSKVEDIMKERVQLRNQVGGLEEKLSGLSQGLMTTDQVADILALKDVIQAQEKSISELLKAVKEQSEHLNYQKNKIKGLENKLNSAALQDTTAKFPLDARTDSVSDYLFNSSTDGSASSGFPSDCGEIFRAGERSSGLYSIRPDRSQPFLVLCEFTDERAFTVVQRRLDGSVDFNQSWQKYEDGFGDFSHEFWLGLRKISSLGGRGDLRLRFQTEDWKHEKRSTAFRFTLEGADSNYTIHLTSEDLSSDVGAPTGTRFSTKDNNDGSRPADPHCARDYTGGWWFGACDDVNLNGKSVQSRPRRKGLHAKHHKGPHHLKSTQISIHHYQQA